MRIRKLIRVLHRDTGYFLFGLVACYAISGLAVNHIDEWNPSYSTSVESVALGPLQSGDLAGLEAEVVARLELDAADVAGRHRPNPREFILFLPNGGDVRVETATGEGRIKRVSTRAFLFESNVLHLNHLKGAWTYVADAFSLLLLGLACTGLFMLKGKTGLAGRGGWFVAAGFLVPIAFLVYYHSTR